MLPLESGASIGCVIPFLLCRELEFSLDEMFDALSACQTQADECARALQIDVKIKKGAALAFGHGPIGQLCNRYGRRVELKFIALFSFYDFCAAADEFLS